MALNIRRVEYFYTSVEDQPGKAYKLLSQLADIGVNLLAFTAILVQGDDELGALKEIHKKLFQVNVNVYASNGVTDGKGSFEDAGHPEYIMYTLAVHSIIGIIAIYIFTKTAGEFKELDE